jgi:serine/threonine-protein kinase HipA
MTSSTSSSEAGMFVWVWLPGSDQPVVCGRVWRERGTHLFVYGRSYRDRANAVPLYGMPIGAAPIAPPVGMTLHGALRDGLPDAWGQHVILARMTGRSGLAGDTGDLDELTYMRESGSDRFGGIDFQQSSDHYVARQRTAVLDDLASASAALEAGRPLLPALDAALNHGTTVGGARPKATLVDSDNVSWIAKFSSSGDRARPAVRYEALALELARRIGVSTVDAHLVTAAGRDTLLVRRFDRGPNGRRHLAVSGLTILQLDELMGRYATYPAMLDKLRTGSGEPDKIGPELFARIATNIAIGNTDDHARNHAALWNGNTLTLTPAYDLDPCRTPGWDANQAMAYGREGQRASNFATLIEASAVYGLSRRQARSIIDRVVSTIESSWDDVVEQAGLTRAQADQLRGSQVLNPGTLEDLARPVSAGASTQPAEQSGKVWVHPHLRGGRPVAGYWRAARGR